MNYLGGDPWRLYPNINRFHKILDPLLPGSPHVNMQPKCKKIPLGPRMGGEAPSAK